MEHLRHGFGRLRGWISAHQLATIVGVGIVLIVLAGDAAYVLVNQPLPLGDVVVPTARPKPKPVVYYSPLTGLKVKNKAALTQPVTGVMIENSPDARPQSGLKQAGVVYEAIAEGGITRFLALYQQEKPSLIGPVRSLRPYDIDWFAPYNASIAHVGGSAEALKEVRTGAYRDIDQFFNGSYYWRSTDRYAPHNVYTSSDKLDALNKAKGYKTSKFTGFKRTDASPAKKPTATKINMTISSDLFNPSYTYDKAHNDYKRYQGGEPHFDREDGQIAPTVVIGMMVNEKTVMQDAPREVITTSGSGKAYIFQNGTEITATWHKENRASRLYFTDKSGEEIALARGQTWISAVPNGAGGVSWK